MQQTLLTAMKPDAIVDAGTQTSPALSRSSSFTWVSTSSLLLHTDDDDDNRSTSSSSSCSPQQSSSRDSLSDSPLGSVERDEPESGIGTASPPRSNKCAGRRSWCMFFEGTVDHCTRLLRSAVYRSTNEVSFHFSLMRKPRRLIPTPTSYVCCKRFA